MSGGHFDYKEYAIVDIIDSIDEYINGSYIEDEDLEYVLDHTYNGEEAVYIQENHHTLPNRDKYSEETLVEMRKGLKILRKAYIYAHRMDWLLAGDDDEDDFRIKLKSDLEVLETLT